MLDLKHIGKNSDQNTLLLKNLLDKVNEIKSIIIAFDLEERNVVVEQIVAIYDEIFQSRLISQHIDYQIKFVSKSIHISIPSLLNNENSYYHLTLKIKSKELDWLNDLYNGQIEDLLQYFKYLFSSLDSLYILRNNTKLEKFNDLTNDITNSLSIFLRLIVKENKDLPRLLKEQEEQIVHFRAINDKKISYKENKRAFEIIIRSYKIRSLYHFTDSKNIESIDKCGSLYSWQYCKNNNITITNAGGNELSRMLDSKKGLENYVRVSFCSKHPMINRVISNGKIKEMAILEVDPEVIYWRGTKYSDINATATGAKIGEGTDYLSNINFSVTQKDYKDLWTKDDFKFYQAEVLVFEEIPIKYIKNI